MWIFHKQYNERYCGFHLHICLAFLSGRGYPQRAKGKLNKERVETPDWRYIPVEFTLSPMGEPGCYAISPHMHIDRSFDFAGCLRLTVGDSRPAHLRADCDGRRAAGFDCNFHALPAIWRNTVYSPNAVSNCEPLPCNPIRPSGRNRLAMDQPGGSRCPAPIRPGLRPAFSLCS